MAGSPCTRLRPCPGGSLYPMTGSRRDTENQSSGFNPEQLQRASHSRSRASHRPMLYHSSVSPSAQSCFPHSLPSADPEGLPSQPAPYLPSGVCALGNQVREIHHQPLSLLGALRRPPTQCTVKEPLINMPACLLSPINHSLSDSFPTFAN